MERSEITLYGRRFSYRSGGRGPLLVLLHGIAGTSATWDGVLPWLAEHYTVVAPDLIGHGESSMPDKGQRIVANDLLYLAADLPTLIIWGELDPLIPVRHGRDAHERIPGSRLEIFPKAGHYPHRDDPRHFVETVVDFVESTKALSVDPKRLRSRLRAGAPTVAAT